MELNVLSIGEGTGWFPSNGNFGRVDQAVCTIGWSIRLEKMVGTWND